MFPKKKKKEKKAEERKLKEKMRRKADPQLQKVMENIQLSLEQNSSSWVGGDQLARLHVKLRL